MEDGKVVIYDIKNYLSSIFNNKINDSFDLLTYLVNDKYNLSCFNFCENFGIFCNKNKKILIYDFNLLQEIKSLYLEDNIIEMNLDYSKTYLFYLDVNNNLVRLKINNNEKAIINEKIKEIILTFKYFHERNELILGTGEKNLIFIDIFGNIKKRINSLLANGIDIIKIFNKPSTIKNNDFNIIQNKKHENYLKNLDKIMVDKKLNSIIYLQKDEINICKKNEYLDQIQKDSFEKFNLLTNINYNESNNQNKNNVNKNNEERNEEFEELMNQNIKLYNIIHSLKNK